MKLFHKILLIIFFTAFFIGCSSTENSSTNKIISVENKICPQCNMPIPKSNIHTSIINNNYYFDDVGCMVLWAKQENIDFKKTIVKVFSNDTKTYIDALKANYTINEKTPMNYGFVAYEKEIKDSIGFEDMKLRMLRGEHMANPKIRKQILGY